MGSVVSHTYNPGLGRVGLVGSAEEWNGEGEKEREGKKVPVRLSDVGR